MSVGSFEALYTEADRRRGERLVRKWTWILGGAVLALLAIYIVGIVQGRRALMLASLMTAFVVVLFLGDMCLLPALRYRHFLRQMDKGLRRKLRCTVDGIKEESVMQDGVRVRVLQVRMCADGDSRIFYVHADHAARIPDPGEEIELESFGRHVTGVRRWDEN